MNVPSGYTALDLIGFTDRGDYVSTDNYVKNDLVHYNGRVWKCRIDDTTAIAPVEGANWTVWIDEAAYLSGLADVTISNPANGEALRYNSQSGKWENVTVDSTPTVGSSNLVQSGGVATQLANKANSADLATVATSGDYQDLNNLPTLADVATTGQYSDLLGAPTIPTVNNGTLTIQVNGANVQTFGANESNNKTANVTVPTKTSDLTNDSNFVSDANYQHITVDSAFSDSSTNPVQNKVVNSLKETFTNNGAHNLLPMTLSSIREANKVNTIGTWSGNVYTYNGGTFTVNTDANGDIASIQVDGTFSEISFFRLVPDGDWSRLSGMLLNGCVSGGSQNSSYSLEIVQKVSPYKRYAQNVGSNSVIIDTIPSTSIVQIYIRIAKDYTANNILFRPMIRLASDTDATYTPYAATNQQLTQETTGLISNDFANGAVNLLPNTAKTQVINGITFTANSDGTVTVNGTATAIAQYNLFGSIGDRLIDHGVLKAGKSYKLSGSPKSLPSGSYMFFSYNVDGNTPTVSEYGNGKIIDIPSGATGGNFGISIGNGATVSNVVFKPMITWADVPNSDYAHYVPYAKSNKELTDDIKPLLPNSYKQIYGASSIINDCNNAEQNIWYYVYGSATNTPDSTAAGILITHGSGANTKVQVFFSTKGIWVREAVNYGTWNSWTKLT